MNRKAREELARRAAKKAYKSGQQAGPQTVARVPDGPPARGKPYTGGPNSWMQAVFMSVFRRKR